MSKPPFLWIVLLALPVALAVIMPARLHREQIALGRQLDEEKATQARLGALLQSGNERRMQLEIARRQLRAELQQIEGEMSPDQRRWQTIAEKLLQSASDFGPPKARRPREGSSVLPVQASVEQPYFPELMGNPDYDRAVAILAQQQVEANFGRFFSSASLRPADQAALEKMLVQLALAQNDTAQLLGEAASADDRSAAQAEAARGVLAEMRSTLSPQVWQQYSQFADMRPYYAVVDKMQTELSYTPSPLQPEQAERVAGLLAQSLGPSPPGLWVVPDSVVAQASSVLAPVQIEALRQIQNGQATALAEHTATSRTSQR